MNVTAYWHEREVGAMGSTARLVVGGGRPDLVEWALDTLALLERTWSRFRPESELCQLNERAGTWVDVTPTLMLALVRAGQLWADSAGAFNPAVLRALESAGYDHTFELVRSSAVAATASGAVPDFGGVEIDLDRSAVRLPPGVALDLGGIGKGLAADMLAEGLVDRGADSVLVSLGGDIRVAGATPSPSWSIPVEDPFFDGRTAFEHELSSGAIVTSTTLVRTWMRGNQRMHHLIDPRTGQPASSRVAAVVAAGPETWMTEGLAKAGLILGPVIGAALLREHGIRAWMFLDDHSVMTVTP